MELVKKTVGLAIAGLLIAGFAGISSAAPAPKVDVCHLTGDGTYNLITISENALPAHEAHGDVVAGTGDLDEDCNEVVIEPERVTSPTMSFGPNGWAGWSCPAGTTAVGGGHTLTSVSDEGIAAPGEDPVDGFTYPTYPHYTFAVDETGYVVHNDNDSESGTVFVDCVANE